MKTNEINNWLAKRKFNERILITICFLALVYYVWDNLINTPLLGSQAQLEKNIKAVQNNILNLKTQLAGLASSIQVDPGKELRDKIARLDSENKKSEAQIAEFTSKLVPPKQMTKVLHEMLHQDEGLEVLILENLPERPLFADPENPEDAQKRVQVYQHGLSIQFRATYFETKKFLEKLETSGHQFIWNEFNYRVEEYPFAVVDLLIYTLSLDKSWIGI